MKEIMLTKGFSTKVDDSDYIWLKQHQWCASITKAGIIYAKRGERRGGINRSYFMHREILGLKKGEFADHKDRNALNNQRSNLRKCSREQNARNKSKKKNGKMKFIGVSKNHDRFSAKVIHKYKSIYCGTFDTQEEAAKAYDEKKKQLHGEFSNLNFTE